MPKKKLEFISLNAESSGQKIRNPLSIAFGSYLRRLRGNYSSDEIAEKMFVTPSYYRMIELGRSNINPARALNLVSLFKQIRLEKLSRLLVVLNITDTALSSIIDYNKAISLLIDSDPGLVDLFDNFHDYFDALKNEESGDQDSLSEKFQLQDNIEYFLTTKSGAKTTSGIPNHFEKALSKLSGIYIEPFFDFFKNLENIPLHMFEGESAKWEITNQYRFKNFIGIVQNYSQIIKKENFQNFNYEYLISSEFEGSRFIFLDPKENTKDIKLKFRTELTKTVATSNLKLSKKLEREFDKKIDIKFADPKHPDIKKFLSEDINGSADIVWIYTLISNNVIGFYRSSDSKYQVNGTTLSYLATNKKIELFEKIFNAL